MAYIKTDPGRLDKTADAVYTYIQRHGSHMQKAEDTVIQLQSAWQGSDYEQMLTEWQQLRGKGSTSAQMLRELEAYAKSLQFAARKYREAQSTALTLSNRLPK